jgi:hypothetical protein
VANRLGRGYSTVTSPDDGHRTEHTGGMLATRYALMNPTAVEQLVLVDPIGLDRAAGSSFAVKATRC